MSTSDNRTALDKAISDALPLAGGKVRTALETLRDELARVDEERAKQPLRYGDRVRVACGATGRYLGTFKGHELALFVSAMDNSVCIDEVRRDGDPPHPDLLAPSGSELQAACDGLRYGLNLAKHAEAVSA